MSNTLRNIGRLTGLLVAAGSAILLAGRVAKSRLKAKYPPPGTLIDVGGHRLHILCQGSGDPTVVFESGLGDPAVIWAKIYPEIAKITRVCLYDRAGLGWSEPGSQPPAAASIVEDLHTLLSKAGITGPCLLVGHSIGGIYVRLYAQRYPHQVCGMVLVDSSHEEQNVRAPQLFADFQQQATRTTLKQLALFKPFANIGAFALAPNRVPADPLLPHDTRATYQALAAKDATFLETVIAEEKAVDISLAHMRAVPNSTLGSMPLVVVSRGTSLLPPKTGLPPEIIQQVNRGWQQMQAELAALSSAGQQIIAEQSGHYIHLEQPQLVIDAIKQVIAVYRQ